VVVSQDAIQHAGSILHVLSTGRACIQLRASTPRDPHLILCRKRSQRHSISASRHLIPLPLARPTDLNPQNSLRQAQIIPDVLNTFSPLLSITANWSSTAKTQLGNTLPPSALSHPPDLYADKVASAYLPSDITFVLALTDPDAPSRDNPKWSQVCHWLGSLKGDSIKELVDYKPPAPPEGTGKHRYVVVVMVPANGTTEELDLEVPGDRRHWGYQGERSGVREFGVRNGLKVIGEFCFFLSLFLSFCFVFFLLYVSGSFLFPGIKMYLVDGLFCVADWCLL